MAKKIKQLTDKTKTITGASGLKYIIHADLTVNGYEKLEELRVEMQAGNTAGEMLKILQDCYDVLNKGKFADASVYLYNAINISERLVDERHPAWLLALTLFARPEGHDLDNWNEQSASEWIADWNEAGYSAAALFKLASAATQNYAFNWPHSSPDTSDGQSGAGSADAVEANSKN